jgi:hypothetical protein
MHDDISFIICLLISSVLSISPFQINRVQSPAGSNMASTIVQYILVRGDLLHKERGLVSCLRSGPIYCIVAGFESLRDFLLMINAYSFASSSFKPCQICTIGIQQGVKCRALVKEKDYRALRGSKNNHLCSKHLSGSK